MWLRNILNTSHGTYIQYRTYTIKPRCELFKSHYSVCRPGPPTDAADGAHSKVLFEAGRQKHARMAN